MKLYFKNSNGERRIIAEPETEDGAVEQIHKFCDDRNFRIYYIRTWATPKGEKIYDVGSHTEHFVLVDDEK